MRELDTREGAGELAVKEDVCEGTRKRSKTRRERKEREEVWGRTLEMGGDDRARLCRVLMARSVLSSPQTT